MDFQRFGRNILTIMIVLWCPCEERIIHLLHINYIDIEREYGTIILTFIIPKINTNSKCIAYLSCQSSIEYVYLIIIKQKKNHISISVKIQKI